VRPEPASGAPGATIDLKMLVVDADATNGLFSAAPRPLQIAWLGGCHNPPGRQYFGCYPLLQKLAEQLAPSVLATDPAALPPGILGRGEQFALTLPDDVLSAAPRAAGDPVHFGVSFAFFGVCAGELRANPALSARVPFECVNPTTGAQLGARDFVTGFTTVFSYDDVQNQNPVISSLRFAGLDMTERLCSSDDDCADWSGAPEPSAAACSSRGRCARVVPPCSGKKCDKLPLFPVVASSEAEALPSGDHEVVWANFYATAGEFDAPTQLVSDAKAGAIADHGADFEAPRSATADVALWVTLSDQRGGNSWQTIDLVIR
jgi:hypothetical protein